MSARDFLFPFRRWVPKLGMSPMRAEISRCMAEDRRLSAREARLSKRIARDTKERDEIRLAIRGQRARLEVLTGPILEAAEAELIADFSAIMLAELETDIPASLTETARQIDAAAKSNRRRTKPLAAEPLPNVVGAAAKMQEAAE